MAFSHQHRVGGGGNDPVWSLAQSNEQAWRIARHGFDRQRSRDQPLPDLCDQFLGQRWIDQCIGTVQPLDDRIESGMRPSLRHHPLCLLQHIAGDRLHQ
jgi:hypothetical protein